MAIFHRINQLDGHNNAVPLAPNAAFQNISDTKRTTNITHIVRFFAAAIFHHACAADHTQLFDFR